MHEDLLTPRKRWQMPWLPRSCFLVHSQNPGLGTVCALASEQNRNVGLSRKGWQVGERDSQQFRWTPCASPLVALHHAWPCVSSEAGQSLDGFAMERSRRERSRLVDKKME